jgi:hypothetical protein
MLVLIELPHRGVHRNSLGLHSDIDRANNRGEHYRLPYLWGWLPSGLYSVTLLILIFIPPAIVGLAVGLGVLWFINLFIPGAFTKDSSNAGIHKDEVMTTQSFTQSND